MSQHACASAPHEAEEMPRQANTDASLGAEDAAYQDLIIFMGATGSGKSSFLNLLAGSAVVEVGHGLTATTKKVKEKMFILDGRRICLVDSPGTNDTSLNEGEILREISEWLETTYNANVRVTGIIYMRDITESKMKGSDVTSLKIFRLLCGTDSLSNVLFVTTKWDICDRRQAEDRHAELRDTFLKDDLDAGAKLTKHDNTIQSASAIVHTLLGNPPIVLNIQRQLVDQKKPFNQTDAYEGINSELTKERADFAEKYAEGLKNAAKVENERMKAILEAANERYKDELDRIDKQKQALEASGSQRDQEISELKTKLADIAQANGKTSTEFIKQVFLTLTPIAVSAWVEHRKGATVKAFQAVLQTKQENLKLEQDNYTAATEIASAIGFGLGLIEIIQTASE